MEKRGGSLVDPLDIVEGEDERLPCSELRQKRDNARKEVRAIARERVGPVKAGKVIYTATDVPDAVRLTQAASVMFKDGVLAPVPQAP